MEYKGMSVYIDPYLESDKVLVMKKEGGTDSLIVSEKIGESLISLNRDRIIEDILKDEIEDEYELLDVFPSEVFPSKIEDQLTTWDIVSNPSFSTSVKYTIPIGNISREDAEKSVKEMISNYKTPVESEEEETDFSDFFFPIAMKVLPNTIGSGLTSVSPFASQDEVDKVKNRFVIENREESIESIIEDKEYIEKKLEDDEEYKELMKRGVTPMGMPQCNLMYMDIKYNNDKTEEEW